MSELYQKIRATPQTPDLNLLFTRLGIPSDPKTEAFDDHAPLAAIRTAITSPPDGREAMTLSPASAPKN